MANLSSILGAQLKGDTGSPGVGVPVGGTTGQFLAKSSGTNYDTSWVTGPSATVTIDNKTANYTVVAGDNGKVITCGTNAFTVSLTAASSLGSGFNVTIWNINLSNGNAITIDPAGSETINGATTLILRPGEGTQLVSDGTNWRTGYGKALRGYAENMEDNADIKAQAAGSRAVAIGPGASASGANGLAIGYFTQASGQYGVAIGMNSAAGGSQAVTGTSAMALGGSYASGNDSFSAAVVNNTNSYGATNTSAISIARLARATAARSVAIGDTSSATAQDSLALGSGTSATNSRSVAIGQGFNGAGTTSSGDGAIGLIGGNATASGSVAISRGALAATVYGKYAFSSSGLFAAIGDSQTGTYVLRRATTDASPTPLTTNSSVSSSDNQVILPNDSTFIFRGQVVARNTGNDADSKCWEFKGAIRRGTNAASTALIGTPSIDLIASDGSAWTIALTADTTNGGLAVTVTGEVSKTIRWVATVNTTEVTG